MVSGDFGFIVVLVIAFFVLGLIGFNLYKNGKMLSPMRETPSPPANVDNENASWNTYKNDEYGFEILYPKPWSFEDITNPDSNSLLTLAFTSPDLVVETKYAGGDWPNTFYKKGADLVLNIRISEYYKSFEQLRETEWKEYKKQKTIKVSGSEALHTLTDRLSTHSSFKVELIGTANDEPLLFEFYYNFPPKEMKRNQPIFDQILSTFKFIE
jgi:hypothetical protein